MPLRHQVTAERPPAAPVALVAVHRATGESPTVVSLGQQLRELLPQRRLQSLSLCDREANVLWLSEGALGPDEHGVLVEALAAVTADSSLACHESALEDGRLAMFLPIRTPSGEVLGTAMVLASSKASGDGKLLERMPVAPVRTILQRLAVLLKPGERSAPVPATEPSVPATSATGDEELSLYEETAAVEQGANGGAASAAEGAHVSGTGTPPAAPEGECSPGRVDQILEYELALEDTLARPARGLRAKPSARAGAATTADTADSGAEMLSLEFIAGTSGSGELAVLAAPESVPTPGSPVATAATEAPGFSPAAPPTVSAAAPAPAVSIVRQAARIAASPVAALTDPAAQPLRAPAAPAAGSDPALLLEVLPFAKLRAGGQTRRFEILARASGREARDPAALDALVVQRLRGWLAAHRAAWNSQPTSFTVSVSIATVEDERFAHRVATALNDAGIAAETLGFEIPEAVCTQRRAQVERFIAQCDKLGFWVLIDNFSLDSQVLPLLRSKALRVVRIDAKLTSSALKDKLSQAMVVATVQAAKVLGIHCAARQVDSQAALQWLTAIGIDFAQGKVLPPVQPLESLAGTPEPTCLNTLIRPS